MTGKAENNSKDFEVFQLEKNAKFENFMNQNSNINGSQFFITPIPLQNSTTPLLLGGGTLNGAIGYNASKITISSDTIDIGGGSGKYSGFVILTSESGTTDTLATINNFQLSYQHLELQAAPGHTITITSADNIDIASSITLTNLETVELFYDIISNTWKVKGGTGTGGGGLSEPVILSTNELVNQTAPTKTIIDASISNVHHIVIDRNIEFDIINPPAVTKQEGLQITIDIDGVGGYASPIWPASVLNPPIIPTTPDTRFTVELYTLNNGILWTHATSVGSSSGGGEFFGPWTGNHDAGLQDLTNLANIDFNDALSTIFGLVDLQWFQGGHQFTSVSGAFNYRVDTNDDHNFFTGASQILKINGSGLDLITHGISNITIAGFVDTGSVVRGSISGDSGTSSLRLSTASGGKFLISDVITDIANFGDAGGSVFQLDMLNHRINNVKHISFDVTATLAISGAVPTIAYDSATNRFRFNVPTGAQFVFEENLGGIATGVRLNPAGGGTVTADIINASDLLQIGIDATVPIVPGEFRNNGTDVTVFTGGVVKNLSDIGTGGSGADVNLSNIINTSIPTDLLPNSPGVFNLGSAALRWGNCFFGRIVFPTNTSPIAGDVNIVRNGDDMQYNVPTGRTFNWTFQSGSTQMELSSTELRLPGVNLDMENNNITDANQIQLTGSSGDTIRGFLSGASGVFDITANENSGLIRLFARTSGGTLNQLLTIDGNAQSTTVGFGIAALLQFGLTGNVPSIARVSDDLQINTNNALELQIAASPVMTITSTDINVFQDLDMDNNVTVDWASTQSTVGAAGAADVIPTRPSSYIIIKVNGTEFVIPAFAKA